MTVPFALTAGLSSLGESKLVVLGGVAELIAGAISMGVGGFRKSYAPRFIYAFQEFLIDQFIHIHIHIVHAIHAYSCVTI